MADKDELDYIKKNEPQRLENIVKQKEWYLELTKIKGIGHETVQDIGVMFDNLEELKNALVKNKVALRNDIVKKLKKKFEVT